MIILSFCFSKLSVKNGSIELIIFPHHFSYITMPFKRTIIFLCNTHFKPQVIELLIPIRFAIFKPLIYLVYISNSCPFQLLKCHKTEYRRCQFQVAHFYTLSFDQLNLTCYGIVQLSLSLQQTMIQPLFFSL